MSTAGRKLLYDRWTPAGYAAWSWVSALLLFYDTIQLAIWCARQHGSSRVAKTRVRRPASQWHHDQAADGWIATDAGGKSTLVFPAIAPSENKKQIWAIQSSAARWLFLQIILLYAKLKRPIHPFRCKVFIIRWAFKAAMAEWPFICLTAINVIIISAETPINILIEVHLIPTITLIAPNCFCTCRSPSLELTASGTWGYTVTGVDDLHGCKSGQALSH